MPDNKRPPKRIKSFRLTQFTFELLSKIMQVTGESESSIITQAVAEYYRNHQEYWPPKE